MYNIMMNVNSNSQYNKFTIHSFILIDFKKYAYEFLSIVNTSVLFNTYSIKTKCR